MEVYVDTLCLLAQPKEGQQQFKNKKQPELSENLTVWKSDNQGVKKETFIQAGRRGRDGRLRWRGPTTSWRLAVSHLQVDKQEEQWGGRQTAQPMIPVPEKKASRPMAVKTCGNCGSRRNPQPHRRVPWRDPQGPRTYTNPPTREAAPERPNVIVGSGGSD